MDVQQCPWLLPEHCLESGVAHLFPGYLAIPEHAALLLEAWSDRELHDDLRAEPTSQNFIVHEKKSK